MLNLGDVSFGLGADTKGLDSAVNMLRQFGRTVDQVARQQVGGSQAAVRAMNAQEKAIRSALQQTQNLQNQLRKAGAPPAAIGQATNSLNALTRAMTSGRLNAVEYTRVQDRFNISMGKLKNQLSNFQAPTEKTGKFNAILKDLQSSAVLASGPLGGLSSRISAINSITSRSTIVTAGAITGFVAFGAAMVKLSTNAISASMELGKINAAFYAATGSSLAAAKEFKYVTDVSQKLGLELGSTAKSYSQFTAAARGTSLEGEQSRKVFEATAMASTALRLSADDTEGVIRALSQMMSKGTVQAEELRGQMGDRIPGAFNLAADAMGVSTRKLGEMMKSGDLLASELLPKLATQMEKVYGGPAQQQAKGLAASLNNLATQQLLFNKAFDDATGVSTKYQSAIEGVTRMLKALTDNMDVIVKVFVVAAGAIAGVGTALAVAFAPTVLGVALAGIRSLTVALGLMSIAGGPLTIALGLIAAALAGGAVAWAYYRKVVEENSGAAITKVVQDVDTFIETQKKFQTATKETTRVYIMEVQKQIGAAQLQLENLRRQQDLLTDEAPNMAQFWAGMGDVTKGPDATLKETQAKIKEREESQKRLLQQLKELQNMETTAIDPSSRKDDTGSGSSSKPKLDKYQETIDDLEVIKQRTQELNALPDFWMQGSESLDLFNKKLNNGKQLESYHDKLVLAGVSQGDLNQKMIEFSEALEASDEAEERFKRIQERAEALDQFGSSALGHFGDFLTSLKDDTADVADSFSDMVTSIVNDLERYMIEMRVIKPLKEAFFGSDGSGGGWLDSIIGAAGSALGGLFGGSSASTGADWYPTVAGTTLPGRARGGKVTSGQAYMVGENGPEAFIPTSSGSISNGNGDVQMNVYITNNTSAQVSATQSNDGRSLEILIDEMTAKNINKSGTKSNRAVRAANSRVIAGR